MRPGPRLFARLLAGALRTTVAIVPLWLAAAPAQAGSPEALESLAQDPSHPDRLVLHYDNGYGGLLASSDGGHTFQILPGLAFTKSGLYRVQPAMRVLGDGKLVVGAPWDGLFVSSDTKGCIKPQDIVPGTVNDLAVHPSDDAVLFFVGSTSSDAKKGLFKRDAAGTITQLGADDGASFSPEGLAVLSRQASSEQLRFVEVGLTGDAGPALRISDDLGQSWVVHAIPVADGSDGTPRLLAVQGTEPLKLVVSLFRDASPDPLDPILYSVDGGGSFTLYPTEIFKTGQAVVAPDGKLYLSDLGTSTDEGGLWMASEIGEPLSKIADYSVHCLGYDHANAQLYLCKRHELGHFDPTSHAYCRMYQLNETASMLCDLATFPKFSESDTHTVAQTVKDVQLCKAWCGASHYSSSPFCAAYDDEDPKCGLSARATDRAGGTSGGWIEPPGTAEPRCAGFEPVVDAGVGLEPADGGASPPADADVTTIDSGTASEDDLPLPRSSASDGCGCSVGRREAGPAPLALGLFVSLLALRRRRRMRS